jgi:hypothetical protein
MNSPRIHAPLSARALLLRQFRLAHDLLETAIEAVQQSPAASATARYAQIVLCEDTTVNGALAAGIPLALSTWVGRTGVNELPLLAELTDWHAWGSRVRVDLIELRSYARAVYTSTEAYLDSLTDNALDQPHGEILACMLNALLLNLSMRRGEILCLNTLGRRPAADEPMR